MKGSASCATTSPSCAVPSMRYVSRPLTVTLLAVPILLARYYLQTIHTNVTVNRGASKGDQQAISSIPSLSVRLLSNDVFGLPIAGDRATAMYALAQLLVRHNAWVHYIAARYQSMAQQGQTLSHQHQQSRIHLHCLMEHDVQQASISESAPYDTSAYARRMAAQLHPSAYARMGRCSCSAAHMAASVLPSASTTHTAHHRHAWRLHMIRAP